MAENPSQKNPVLMKILDQIKQFLDENDEEYFSENRDCLKELSEIVSIIARDGNSEDAALLHVDISDMYYRSDCSDGMDGHILEDEECFLQLMEDYIDKGFEAVWQKLENYVVEFQNPADSLYGFGNLVQVGHYIRRKIEDGDEEAGKVYGRIFDTWSKTNKAMATRTKAILDNLDLEIEWYEQIDERPEYE